VLLDNSSTKAEAATGSSLLGVDNDDRTARLKWDGARGIA